MRTPLLTIGSLVAILIGVLVAFGAFREPPAPISVSGTPTDFSETGTLVFDEPVSAGQDTIFFEYYAPDATFAPLKRELAIDEESMCASETGAAQCMAISSQFSTVFSGKSAQVEGTITEDDKVLVRKLRVVPEGVSALSVGVGRVFIPWAKAVELIRGCSVSLVMQTHSLDVNLTLKDGREFTAVEPMIDDVFQVHSESQSACGNVPVATE